MRQRSRTMYGQHVEREAVCELCKKPSYGSTVFIGRRGLCFVCAWSVVDELGKVYSAPEISALERIKHRRENGDGWRSAPINNVPGWVYYIRMGDAIKIGYASDVTKRMRAYPPNAELLAAHPGTMALEKQIQHKFVAHLQRGREWFNPAPDILDHVDRVIAEFGDNSGLAYEYTRPKTQEERVQDMFKTRHSADVARGVHSAV